MTALTQALKEYQVNQLKDEELYTIVTRIFLFFGIEEEAARKDAKEILVNFLTKELGIEDAFNMELQRVLRVGKQNPSVESPGKLSQAS